MSAHMQHLWRSSVWFLVSVRCRSGAWFASAAGGEAEERSHILRPIPTRLHQTTARQRHRASERSGPLQTSRGLSYEWPNLRQSASHTLNILSLLQSVCSSGTCVWLHKRDTHWVPFIRYVHYREVYISHTCDNNYRRYSSPSVLILRPSEITVSVQIWRNVS